MTLYRDPDVAYRQPGEPYEGDLELVPGLDMDRLDHTQVRVVDKYGVVYGELSASQIGTVHWKLLGPNDTDAGSTTLTMSSYDPTVPLVKTGEREVQVVFWDAIRPDTDEPVIWWGRAREDHRTPGTVEFELDDVAGWLQERLCSVNKDYGPVPLIEQLDIAWDLINFAQTGPNMDLNFESSYAPSGRHRERHYNGDQKSPIWDLLCNFIGIIDGFDWWFDYNLSGQRLWTPEYPSRGVVTDLHFEWGHNIVGFDLKSTDKELITRYWAQGGDDGAGAKLEASFEDVAASAQFNVRERAGGEGSQESTLAGLAESAESKVMRNNDLARTFSISVWEGSNDDSQPSQPILGRLWPGDWVLVVIEDGSTSINDTYRVSDISWLPTGGIDLELFA